jgi:hypothetical protein
VCPSPAPLTIQAFIRRVISTATVVELAAAALMPNFSTFKAAALFAHVFGVVS